jgi:cyclomaltodextrinase / maltogenic alpha-amylase / neopullulanase
MEDFIFGPFSTNESRFAHVLKLHGGVTHAQLRVPRDPQPGQAVQIHLNLGPSHPHDQAWVYWTNDGSDPVGGNGVASNGFVTALHPISSEWDILGWGYIRHFWGEIPGQETGTVVRYRVAAGGGGEEVLADDGAYYGYYVDNDPPPAWTRDAVIYQIFADRFFSSAPDFPRVEVKPSLKGNGTLRGITDKLDYLADLGINCLWLTPIFSSPSYHGYDATSFFEINPRLGTKEDFKELIDQAHARGIRLLMDFVPNHWSNQHPGFVEALKDQNGESAKWYTFEQWPHRYKSFFNVRTLPQINLRYAPARQHVLDAARYWLELGVDGYRVDHCIGPTPDFYADFRRVTRMTNPESWTFGEAVDPPDSQITFEGGMDGTLDFMLLEAIRKTFVFGSWDAQKFADFLDRHEAYFPATFSRPSFLDNHDMNRYLWVAHNDIRKLRLAALCQFTLAGPPVIYYGTEVGLSQHRDVMQNGRAIHEETRLPMLWGMEQNKDLFAFYQGLIQLRASHEVLRKGIRQNVFANDKIFAYRRTDEKSSLIIALNLSEQEQAVELPFTEPVILFATGPGCTIQIEGGRKEIYLPAYGGVVIK